jgi:hypothetical protein
MAFEFLDRWQHKGNEFFGNLITKSLMITAGLAAAYFGIKWLGDKYGNKGSSEPRVHADSASASAHHPPEELRPSASPSNPRPSLGNQRGW